MNRKQKAVVLVGLALIVATGLYVPVMTEHIFVASNGASHVRMRYFAGYTWMFHPKLHQAEKVGESGYLRTFRHVDNSRVLIQWAMVVFVVVGLVSTLRGRKPETAKTLTPPDQPG